MRSGKNKAVKMQNEIAMRISELTGIPCGKDELIASREMGQSGTDVRLIGKAQTMFPWSVECKYQETWSIPAWIKQAKENQKKGTNWLLFIKRNQHEEIVVLNADVFFDLLTEENKPKLVKRKKPILIRKKKV